MSLDGALSIATGGLANINSQMALVSQNVANASTPGYAAEIGTQQSVTADGVGLGVRSGPAMRDIDAALQARGVQPERHRRRPADPADRLAGDRRGAGHARPGQRHRQPARQPAGPVLHAAERSRQPDAAEPGGIGRHHLAQGINTLSNAYTAQRQTAQDNIVAEVGTLNTTLSTIGGLSDQIVTLKAGGQSTADLENQRDAAVATLSQLVDVKVLEQPNGDVLITTRRPDAADPRRQPVQHR